MTTPDTEKFDVIGWLRNTYGLDDDDCLSAGRVQELCESLVHDVQTSRDTYWKERVRKEVEGMERKKSKICFEQKGTKMQQIKQRVFAQGYNQALDTLLDNLK